MAKKHLHTTPHIVSDDFWWYEENRGMAVYVRELRRDGKELMCTYIIPWRAVRAALSRKDAEGCQ